MDVELQSLREHERRLITMVARLPHSGPDMIPQSIPAIASPQRSRFPPFVVSLSNPTSTVTERDRFTAPSKPSRPSYIPSYHQHPELEIPIVNTPSIGIY
jgi:hypothetical protein